MSSRDKRDELIIELAKKRMPNWQIGKQFGLTPTGVRKIILRIKKARGEKVLQPEKDEKMFSLPEAAKLLRLSKWVLWKMCRTGEISTVRYTNIGPRYISVGTLEKLKSHPKVCGKCKCVFCGKEIVVEYGKRRKKICNSRECYAKQRARSLQEVLKDKKKMAKRLKGWKKEFWLEMQKRVLPGNEEWIKLGQAQAISGLRTGQFFWLIALKLISRKPMTTGRLCRRDRQRPTRYNLYAKSEMELIRQLKGE